MIRRKMVKNTFLLILFSEEEKGCSARDLVIIKRRKTPHFLQLQYLLTCSCMLIPCLILLTETSESDKKLIFI